jgi:penicillin-insensitive murein endopeptidase
MRSIPIAVFALTVMALVCVARAQPPAAVDKPANADKAAVPEHQAAPPAAVKPPPVPAKSLFGAVSTPAPLATRAIGFYAQGCLSGGRALPIDGPTWQAMRLSRNRNWGHPQLVSLIERLSKDAKAQDNWPGLLVGDMSQPRGGPMRTGHASHQVGLDADIWLTPMPDHRLSETEREKLSATSMLGADEIHVDPKVWSEAQSKLIRRAASYPQVERIFVHPGIKKAICLEQGIDRTNLHKIRPYWGHHYHMHVRIACPHGDTLCKPQPSAPQDDGCGKEVDDWIARLTRMKEASKAPKPPPDPKVKPKPPKPPLTLAELPAECRGVLEAGTAAAPASAAQKVTPPVITK